MIGRLRAWLGRARVAAAPPAPVLPPPPTLREELQAAGVGVADWIAARASSASLYSTLAEPRIAALRREWPALSAATVAAADRVIAHEFDLLGSGPYVPVDPNRPARGSYRPIDWYLDPVRNLRFPERVPHTKWNLLEMRPGLADVKYPWELGRCQHWVPLAQAFRLTHDARYATEVLDQHDDFMEANPVGLGVNWTCTMDVAIRAFNWAIALDLIQSPRTIDSARIERVYSSIFDTCHFIERNLENKYEVTSNHFLSNVVGLFGAAQMFRGLASGDRWRARGRDWLEQEMRVQVLPDGADYESSVPYHRLVAELFFAGSRLALNDGAALSADYDNRLRAMMEFQHAVLRPDGRLPQIGDADDGRVHIFSDYGKWQPQDGRHLLAPASVVFDVPEWFPTDAWSQWEASWWGMTPPYRASASPAIQKLFPDAGLAVSKADDHYLLVSNGKVGTNGFGNHKHNDLLSFEYHDRGQPLIVDPGSYVYTSDPDARNHFRSTAAHNTLVVDNEEQNEFKTEWLFRMFEKARPEHVAFASDAGSTSYRGRHDGYVRLATPVMHERLITRTHGAGILRIDDLVTGKGTHALRWHFHFAPGVDVSAEAAGVMLSAGSQRWRLTCEAGIAPILVADWYSPSYGVKVPSQSASFEVRADLSSQQRWSFLLERAE